MRWPCFLNNGIVRRLRAMIVLVIVTMSMVMIVIVRMRRRTALRIERRLDQCHLAPRPVTISSST